MRTRQVRVPSKLQDALRKFEYENRPNCDAQSALISADVGVNESRLKDEFRDCFDIVYKPIRHMGNLEILVVYIDGLVNTKILEEMFVASFAAVEDSDGIDRLKTMLQTNKLTAISKSETFSQFTEIVRSIVEFNVAVFVSGEAEAYVLHMPDAPERAVEEPVSETLVRGPREGFTESLRTNTALLRKKLKSHLLRAELLTVGSLSNTSMCLVYIDGIVNLDVLHEVRTRVEQIEIDSVLDSGYIEEFIEDSPYSPFPQVQNTERPDVVLANLVEGKIGILVDGSPFALIVPLTFWGTLQSAEDYYERFLFMTPIRWLRFIFMGIALFLPSIYVALTTFHPQLIPMNLILTFAQARESSPFPAIIEALIMEIVFEALREASIRLPQNVGSSVSIVGGLVIGQAAVQAGIVSAPMVIVVATTGIASFTIPRYNFALSFRILRFPILLLSGVFGFFGITVGMITILIHLVSLRSFGIPYLSPVTPTHGKSLNDVLIRAPRWSMGRRPPLLANWRNPRRFPSGQKPSPKRAR